MCCWTLEQVHLLKELRPQSLSALEISSVDGFQGREKEAIIISMVRLPRSPLLCSINLCLPNSLTTGDDRIVIMYVPSGFVVA